MRGLRKGSKDGKEGGRKVRRRKGKRDAGTEKRNGEGKGKKEKTRLVPSEIVSTHSKMSESERAEEQKGHTSAASKIFANFMFALTFTVISKLDRTRQST